MWVVDTTSSVFLFLWWQYNFVQVTEHLCDCFQCPSHLGSLTPSQRVDLVCAVFVCWNSSQPVLGIFDMCTNVNGCTQVPYNDHKRVCAESWCWEKISLPHRELEIGTSNLVIQSLKKPEVLNSSLALKSLKQNYKVLDASYLDMEKNGRNNFCNCHLKKSVECV